MKNVEKNLDQIRHQVLVFLILAPFHFNYYFFSMKIIINKWDELEMRKILIIILVVKEFKF